MKGVLAQVRARLCVLKNVGCSLTRAEESTNVQISQQDVIKKETITDEKQSNEVMEQEKDFLSLLRLALIQKRIEDSIFT